MTPGNNGRGPGQEPAPQVQLHAITRTGAGNTVVVELGLHNPAPGPRLLTVSVLGLDAGWLPMPMQVGPVPAGGSTVIEFDLRPPAGTVPARYPFAVAVQATDPAFGRSFGAPTGPSTVAEGALVVDEPSRMTMEVHPADSAAVFGRRIEVLLRNAGGSAARIELSSQIGDGASIRLSRRRVEVPPGGSARIRGRVSLNRPRLLGGRNRYQFLIAARGLGAPTSSAGSVTSRAAFSPVGAKVFAIVAVVALWAGLAMVGIPKLAGVVRGKQANTVAAGPASSGPSAGGSGAAGSGAAGSAAANSSRAAAAGKAAAAAAAALKAAGVRLNGTVTGTAPGGVAVSLQPTSLVDEKAESAQPVGESAHAMSEALYAIGKVPAAQLALSAQTAVAGKRATATAVDGSWSLAGISSPGYYLLTFTKPGYQTRKYIINAADANAAQPLPVAMTAGQGSLTGQLTGPGGRPVGGATISITDGQNTVATSSNSTGQIGRWKVDGLSTPGTFLVSASKDGLSLESGMVTLGAGASATVNLALRAGVGSLVGTVQGTNSLGVTAGIGGATVTATDGTITRTATTVTSGPIGSYTLPALPAPGRYSVTIASDGYLPQTQQVVLTAGQSKAAGNAVLTPATAVVQGTVTDSSGTGLVGAGMVLTGTSTSYKTMSVSSPVGSFRFNGVTPGTYVLGAELFGRQTSYATVVARVGQVATVTLKLDQTPGGVLPSTAHARGRITDARTGGPLTCDQAPGYDPVHPGSPANLALCRINVGVDVSPDEVKATCLQHQPPVAGHFLVCDVDPALEYTVPSVDAKPAQGLLPGLHHIAVYAAGYEGATVDVQVPLGVTVEAPQLALYPSASIIGTVNATVGSLSTGPDPAFADDPDETVPAGQDYAHQVGYRTCAIVVPASPAPATDPTCSLVPPAKPGDPVGCSSTTANSSCSLTSTSDGSYTVRGLPHGTYLVYIHPLNPEYRPVSGAQVILDRGATGRYDANLHRMGRVVLSVLAPNDSGGLVNASGVPVTVVPKPAVNQHALVTGIAGRVRVIGLDSGAHTFSASQTTNAGKPNQVVNAGSTSVPVGDDQEISSQLALTSPTSQLIGQVSSSYTGSIVGIPNASVTVSGVVAYSGTTPIRTQVTVTTDSNGCFAVTADGNAPTAGIAPCTDLASIPRARLPLVVKQADLSVTAANFQPYNVIGRSVNSRDLVGVPLEASPQTITGSVSVDPVDPANPVDLSKAILTVTQKAPGTGRISVSVSPTPSDPGAISWQDSQFSQAGLVQPGKYTISASLAGYASDPVTFSCDAGVPCSIGNLVLQRLGGLDITAVDAGGTAVNNAVFTLSGGNVPPVTQTAPPGTSEVSFANLVPGAKYTVKVQAAGFAFDSSANLPVKCPPSGAAGAITISAGTVSSCSITLTRLGAITGKTEAKLNSTQTQPLGNVLLKATYCGASVTTVAGCPAADPNTPFSAVSGADGTFRITGSNSVQGLAAGGWVVDESAHGYAPEQREFFQVAAADTDPTRALLLDASAVNLKVGVADSASDAAKDLVTTATLVLTPADGSSAAITINPPAKSSDGNLYVFSQIAPKAYSLQISGPNLSTLTVQVTVFVGVPDQTIYVRTDVRTNTVTGVVSGEQGTSQVPSPLDGAAVSLTDVSDSKNTFSTTSGKTGGAGYFAFPSVPDGSYVLTFSLDGYVTNSDTTVTVAAGQNATVTLSMIRVKNNVVVNLTSVNGFSLTGAIAFLTAVPANSNPAQGSQPLSGSGTAYTASFSQVPSGSWKVWVQLPTDHHGTVLTTDATPVAVTSTAQYAVTVSGAGPGNDSTVALSLTEDELDLKVPVTPLANDGRDAPDTAKLSVTHSTTTVYQQASFPTSSGATSNIVRIWVTPGQSYTLSADPGSTFGTGWTSATSTITPTSSSTPVDASVTLKEKSATLAVTVKSGATVVSGASVTVTPTDSLITAPDPQTTPASGIVTFTGLPPGSYSVSVSKDPLAGSGSSTLAPGSNTLTVTIK